MLEKLKVMEEKYNDINEKLMDIEIINDTKQYAAYMKEYKSLTPIVDKYREYIKYETQLKEAEELIESKDKEILSLKELPKASDENIDELKAQITELQIEIQNRDNIIAEANEKIEKIQIKRERIAENKKAAKQIEDLTTPRHTAAFL